MTTAAAQAVINRNEDWLRTRSWDLPTTLEGLTLQVSGVAGLKHLMTLPAWEAVPPALAAEVQAFIDGDGSEPWAPTLESNG